MTHPVVNVVRTLFEGARHFTSSKEDPAQICRDNPTYLRVLLVEDQFVNQQVGGFIMEPFGAKFFTLANGEEGLEAFETATFDVIFVDMQMLIKDGLAATREIRPLQAKTDKMPMLIIMLTANAGKAIGAKPWRRGPICMSQSQ